MFVSTREIEVRYAETDQMGVVYHANYLIWMELGRTQLIKDLGFNYAELEKDGILSPVMDIQASYKKPLLYGQKAIVKTWIEEYDGLRVNYGYEIFNEEGELAVTGLTKHVCVKKDSFRPLSIRKKYPEWHEAYEKAKKQPVEAN
ncbi:acyl-CoA thioesterase [Cytobacillus praedii]|uniref:Acyl-CoA thioesterase n=1 Tax=Cytobacillus praedii TaxID=1742358 RepID=A0A4R1ATX3_9BACI|nr:thioesterase family protein [Cytobacillus praedii]MED3551935.1 thioesterase family protein [Cytobacillus praedii]MED3573161.1 thioesterase family protein [Cytobacillus praedii]TCJ03545.1 acyl-CoA thioesterase [Cytobacillus praedii]